MRIAAIDIGTNSIHMVVADAHADGRFDVVDRERDVVQIGRGSFAAGRLRHGAIRRTALALQRFVQLARRHQVDRILCTATAAVREARNGGEFLAAAREISGITPRVIPAVEEGRLIYRGITSALPLDDEPTLIVDIGGGSMQLVVGSRERLLEVLSAPVGALRLTEQLDAKDPLGHRDLARLRRLVRRGAREALQAVKRYHPVRVVGASGSIHALAHVAAVLETGEPLERLNGAVLTRDALRTVRRRLSGMTLAERERLPGLDARRAEIIVPGAIVLEQVLDAVDADAIMLSDFGVREGLVVDYAANHAREVSATERIEDLRMRSVLHCLARFQAPIPHTEHVARLALAMFDDLRPQHGLGADARDLLHHAAMLHDIGSVVGYDQHGGHSYYIIKNAGLMGFMADELERVALVARFHGKARPRRRVPEFALLPKATRREIRWLSAILCIAEALDRSHYQLIESVRLVRSRRGWTLLAKAKRGARLELWAASGRVRRLERLLGARIQVRAAAVSERTGARERRRVREQAPASAEATAKPRVLPLRRRSS